eukprot:COSAG03_NODE_18_length_21685_cov_15.938988_19_plen_44_part_00
MYLHDVMLDVLVAYGDYEFQILSSTLFEYFEFLSCNSDLACIE